MGPIIKEKRILIGAILIAVGLILSLEKMNVMFFPDWLISWQMLLITIGVFSILANGKLVPGVILLAIGGFFLIDWYFHDIGFNIFALWPLFLVVAGVLIITSIITHRDKAESKNRRHSGWDTFTGTTTEGKTDEDFVDEVAIFGGGHKVINSPNFKGGKMTAIFGGSELDLTAAELAEGVNYMEVVAMFGGWELRVPAHWNIEVRVTPIFGGFDDKRITVTGDPVDNTRKLIVKGIVIFGGGEIKSHIVRK